MNIDRCPFCLKSLFKNSVVNHNSNYKLYYCTNGNCVQSELDADYGYYYLYNDECIEYGVKVRFKDKDCTFTSCNTVNVPGRPTVVGSSLYLWGWGYPNARVFSIGEFFPFPAENPGEYFQKLMQRFEGLTAFL